MSAIPYELKLTTVCDEFIICNKQPKNNDQKIVLGFGSPTALDTLDSTESWYGEVTFTIFSQADMEKDQIFPRTRFVNIQNFRKKYISKFLTITKIIVEIILYRL